MNKVWKAGLCAVIATAAVLAGSASPAAADHFIGATETSCFSGPIAGPLPTDIRTEHFSITWRGDGSLVLRCIFHDLPDYVAEEDSQVGLEYFAPKRATRYDGILCSNPLVEGYTEDSTFTVTPGGTGIATCVFLPAA